MVTARLLVGAWLMLYFAAAVPVWWHLTAIKRPHLPFDRMMLAAKEQPLPHSKPQKLPGTRRRGILSFTLFNADAFRDSYSWDFEALYRAYLHPHILRLQPLTRFEVQSQVLQGGLVQPITPRWSTRHAAYVLAVREMPLLLDLNWGDVSVQGGHDLTVLRWVIYMAPRHQRPLYLESPDGSLIDSCVLPDWGGIVLVNPPSSSNTTEQSKPVAAGGPAISDLKPALLQGAFATVAAQLREHMGLPMATPTLEPGASDEEMQVLLQQARAVNAAMAADSLASMARLLQSLPALQMPDSVGDQVYTALHNLQVVRAGNSTDDGEAALAASYAAREMAEEAFQSPSILAQLSFPAAHKLAIYLPFFLPVSLPIIVNTIRELQSSWRLPARQQTAT